MQNKFLLVFLFVSSNLLFSQSIDMTVINKNGTRNSYNVFDVRKITFTDIAGGSLQLSYPLSGATEVSTTPILKWNMIAGAKYSLQVSLNQDLSDPFLDVTNMTVNNYQIIAGLKGLTKYYWRVKNENDGNWSEIWSFMTSMPFLFSPNVPKSFAVINEKENSLSLIIKSDPAVQNYMAYIGKDGMSFTDSVSLLPDNTVINNLQNDSLYFIKLKAVNSGGYSAFSEVLAGVAGRQKRSTLLVHGFDRKSTGNTFNFIRFHALAFIKNNQTFASSTNDAITDGLISLRDFKAADYILGDESTADETLSNTEQDSLKVFLSNGGNLLISGSEIGWDLDTKGTAADKNFINNYLKASFIADAPLNQAGVYYQIEGLSNSIFSTVPVTNFDNGTQGTINVRYPDAIKPLGSAKPGLKFTGVDTTQGLAGVYSEGLCPNGIVPCKTICLSVPFETIYPEGKRNLIMQQVTAFFFNSTGVNQDDNFSLLPSTFKLFQNYPNPFNPVTKIKYALPRQSRVKLKIFDMLGKEIITLVDQVRNPGTYEVEFAADNLPSGIYLYRLDTDSFSETRKLCLLK